MRSKKHHHHQKQHFEVQQYRVFRDAFGRRFGFGHGVGQELYLVYSYEEVYELKSRSNNSSLFWLFQIVNQV